MPNHILHISDIHIRCGNLIKSRFEEYYTTFNHLINSVSSLPCIKDIIIVITGDLFHHKNKIEPYGLQLAVHLLQGLSSLATVYLIRGNHDYRQDTPAEDDMITALMSYKIPNVNYLDKTGTYSHENIAFGLVAIQDTLLYGATTGITSTLPPFPVPIMNNIEHKIAIFHGTISGSTLQTDNKTLHGYPLDWFQGFDAILLGDIHLQQVHRAEKVEHPFYTLPNTMHLGTYKWTDTVPWAYPGSLIQQDFGEQLIGHGYLLWNLKDKLVHAMHIYNSTGFLKLRNNMLCGSYTVDSLQEQGMMPINVMLSTTGDCTMTVDKLRNQDKNIIYIKTAEQKYNTLEDDEKKEHNDIVQINSITVLIEYLQNIITVDKKEISTAWQSWLKNPEHLIISTVNFPEQLAKKINDRSDKIQKAAVKYLDDFEKFTSQQHITGKLHIHSLQWSWILNYKDGNYYDFDTTVNQISIINAKNGAGKSNFLEIICIAIFGEGFPSRENLNYSAGIICDKRPEGVTPNTTIVFSINGTKYKLFRTMRTNTISRLINYDKIILSTIVGDSDQVIHQQKGAVHPWIQTNIGTLETYLMTAMLSQNADQDFFSLEKTDQKVLLDRIMSLDHINSLKAFLKETDKYYKYVCDLIETYHDGSKGTKDPNLGPLLQSTRERVAELQLEHDTLQSAWNMISEQTLIQCNIDTANIQYDEWMQQTCTDTLEELNGPLAEINEQVSIFTSHLQEYNSFEQIGIKKTKLITTPQKFPKYMIHLTYLRTTLEEHPFNKTHSLYEQDIEKHITDDSLSNEDCSQELFQSNRDFETWNAIKVAEFAVLSDIIDSTLVDRLEQCSIIAKEYPSRIAQYNKHMKILRKKHLLKRAEKDDHLEKRPNRPNKSIDWLDITSGVILSYSADDVSIEIETILSKSIQIVPMLCTTIITLHKQITDMEQYIQESTDLPFNSKCKSCRVQPWRKTFDLYAAELPLLRNTLADKDDELQACLYQGIPFDINDYNEYISQAENRLLTIRRCIRMCQEYHSEKSLSDTFQQWSTQYDLICKQCDTIETECETLECTLQNDQTVLQNAISDKHEIDTTLAKVNQKKKEYELYCVELLTKRQQFELNAKKLTYNWYSILHDYHMYVSSVLEFIKSRIESLVAKRNAIQERIDMYHQWCNTQKKAVELQLIIEAYPQWIQWKTVREELHQQILYVRELETKQGGKYGDGIDIDSIKTTMDIVCYLSDKFDGYREWLYKSHIGPMIQSHVNAVLSVVCEDRPLYLEAEWLDKINTLSWFVRDGSSRPVIEKASGFQRFIIGMATRVAFHQIGFCRIQYDQLFIDEGFTSCDSDNLEKVPEFLRSLLRMYNSIYLATHLEELKICSHAQIVIDRDATGLSQIAYGVVTDVVEQPVKRSKGRPSKATAASNKTKITVIKE